MRDETDPREDRVAQVIFPRPTVRVGKCLGFLTCHGSNGRKMKKGKWVKRKMYINYEGELWVSSRLSYHLNNAPIPRSIGKKAKDGLVLHTCDNMWCVEPTHLYLGNRSRNLLDVYERLPHRIHSPSHRRSISEKKKAWWTPARRKAQSLRLRGNDHFKVA